ncbi:hypothetical protein LCGC14_0825420 [marine sediment metagenome]|uniref:Uncharacterized protein n=1 Tax=marine sediment metagenome TaxID=412755 RepID=A0A0F9S2G6_9ZZZZ
MADLKLRYLTCPSPTRNLLQVIQLIMSIIKINFYTSSILRINFKLLDGGDPKFLRIDGSWLAKSKIP